MLCSFSLCTLLGGAGRSSAGLFAWRQHPLVERENPSNPHIEHFCRRPKGFHRQRIRARTAAAKAAAAAGNDGSTGSAAAGAPVTGPGSAPPDDGRGVRSDGQQEGGDAEASDVAAAEWQDLDVPQFHQVCTNLFSVTAGMPRPSMPA